jgi:hypothetical protein
MANNFAAFLWKRAYGNYNFGVWLNHVSIIFDPNRQQNFRILDRHPNIEDVEFQEHLPDGYENVEEIEENPDYILCYDVINKEHIYLGNTSDEEEEDENEDDDNSTDSEED